MILTTCAACAAPLAHNAPRCVRCKLRYCNATCQHDHWRRGHKQMCKKIHRGGNAEQYNADKKYKEAVAVAVEKCADDTKGQKCYICLETVHRRTGEGLVRGCACHTSEGFVHVSCLVERAKILVDEAEGGKSAIDMFKDSKNQLDKWDCWRFCNLCGHEYHGVVKLGPNAEITLRLRWGYASVLLHDDPSSEEDTREAVRVLEDVVRRVTQGYGEAHPLRKWTGETLIGAQKHLALIEASK